MAYSVERKIKIWQQTKINFPFDACQVVAISQTALINEYEWFTSILLWLESTVIAIVYRILECIINVAYLRTTSQIRWDIVIHLTAHYRKNYAEYVPTSHLSTSGDRWVALQYRVAGSRTLVEQRIQPKTTTIRQLMMLHTCQAGARVSLPRPRGHAWQTTPSLGCLSLSSLTLVDPCFRY